MSDDLRIKRLEERQDTLEREHRSIVTRIGEVAVDASTGRQMGEMAQKTAAEALHTAQATARLVTEQVAAVEQGIRRHLTSQDEHLARQDKVRESQGRVIAELHRLEVERTAREKADREAAEKAKADAAEAERRKHQALEAKRKRRDDALKVAAFLLGLPASLVAVAAAFHAAGSWLRSGLLRLLHLSQ